MSIINFKNNTSTKFDNIYNRNLEISDKFERLK